MIFSSSHLIALLMQKVRFKCVQSAVDAGLVTIPRVVFGVGVSIAAMYVMLSSFDLFMYLTAAFIILAYVMSMITLLTLKKEWLSGQNSITVLALITALTIFFFSWQGIVQECIRVIT